MSNVDSTDGGGRKQASPAALIVLVVAVGLLSGAIGGLAVSQLDGSSESSGEPAETLSEPAPTQEAPLSQDDEITAAVTQALPSVVAIINQFEAQEGLDAGTVGGAGVVVDDRGFVLTNAHLVTIPGELFVILSTGEVRDAQVVSHDAPYTDVAVLQIAPGGLVAIEIADSNELALGETVLAIGSPDIDYFNSVSRGVVSGLGRRKQVTQGVWYEDLIQTDAAINVGSSGGALINLDGEMVGLNTFRDVGAEDPLFGISFAISSRVFVPIAQEMIETGSFARPYMGVRHVDLTPPLIEELGLPEMDGALVQEVTEGTPAAAAGLQEGDIITMFGQIPLTYQFGLWNALGVTLPEANITLEVLRDGETLSLDLQLEPR